MEAAMAQEKMTERLVTVVLTLVVAGVLGVLGTALARGALIGALGGVQETEPTFDQRVRSLSDRVQALRAKIEGATTVPTGAVMVFDLSSGCPDGWTEFADAAGRTIVGQGSGMVDENRQPLTGRKYREHGGEERHTLTEEEMPKHGHGQGRTYFYNVENLNTFFLIQTVGREENIGFNSKKNHNKGK